MTGAPSSTSPEDVLRFWFGEPGAPPLESSARWWKKDDAFDREIRERFLDASERGVRGELKAWEATPRGRLALIILYDQFSRNMFRGTARAFGQDGLAREVVAKALAAGDDRTLAPIEVTFLLMPLMHAEDLSLQAQCAEGFARLRDEATDEKLRATFASDVKYAAQHKAIIERFGRFPHRNAVLGRASTEEEEAFLKEPGSSF